MSELINYAEGRKQFIESLQNKTSQPFIVYEHLTQIAALIKELLSSMIRDNENDPFVFSNIVGLSDAFYTFENGKKKFLAYFISPHAVWEDPKRWFQAINYNISNKAASDKENSQKMKKKSKFMSFLAEIVKNTGPEKAEKASVYLILSKFSYHMVKLNVHNDIACAIIMNSGKEYEINDEKVMLLISEIQARSDIFLKFPQKNRIHNRSFSEILKISSKFLEYKDICELSLVSKQLNSVLFRKKYKKVILSRHILKNHPEIRRSL